jgi:KDO2-lipid IV(A) lauroyltransferase
MYHLLYGFLYLLSLLPWRVMYIISDGLYVLIFYIIGYRKEVVKKNLLIAFPEKTEEERLRIAKDFYHNFLDTMVEIIKLISIDEKEFKKRITSNVEVLNDLKGKVPNVAIVCGHFFNWEIGNLAASLESKFKLLAVYMPIENKPFDKIMYDMRKKFGAIMIPATDFKNHFLKYSETDYALGLIADQNPADTRNAYWLPFFNKLTPFVKGPEKNAKRNNSAVVFVNSSKPKRGYYIMNYILVTTEPNSYSEGALTKELITLIEKSIQNYPSNYLWSHRRFKHEFKEEEHRALVVE